MVRLLSLVALLMVSSIQFAQAGNLFPPANSAANVKCPNDQVLTWTGNSVTCVDPSPGVTTDGCQPGQYVTGIEKGQVKCGSDGLISGCKNPRRGGPLCLGITQNVNAGVVTMTCGSVGHLYGNTQFIGYTLMCD